MQRLAALLFISLFVTLTTPLAQANSPLRKVFFVQPEAILSLAQSTLSADGLAKLQTVLTSKSGQEQGRFDSAFFFKPALSPDLLRGDPARVKNFLDGVNEANLVMHSTRRDSPSDLRVFYQLEEQTVAHSEASATPTVPDKRYFLKVLSLRQGDPSPTLRWTSEFLFDVEAAKSGDTATLAALLAQGYPVNARDPEEGQTLLMHAALSGQSDVPRLLLEKGADVNAQDKFGHSVLIHATERGNESMVKLLLSKGAQINQTDDFGTALTVAANIANNMNLVRLLVESGADVNKTCDGCATALIRATQRNGNKEIIQFLLDKGADINTCDSYGRTALMQATQYRDTLTLTLLLEKGADVNAKAKDGSTALMMAASGASIEMVKTLIANGADVNARSTSGDTALSLALRRPLHHKDPEMEALLRNAGARKPNKKGSPKP